MEQQELPPNVVTGAIAHMNADHQKALLDYARGLVGCTWATSAEMTTLDATGFKLQVQGEGRTETHRIAFPHPVQDGQLLRTTLVQMAQQTRSVDAPDGLRRVARARVETPNALRYLKALCNHFDRGATGQYEGERGTVQFSFGMCELEAQADALLLQVEAESDTMFERVRHVVADHLVRFGNKETLTVAWETA
jgi:hypothetical protein